MADPYDVKDMALIDAGLAPVSRVRVLAATKSLFGFCYRMHLH